MLNKCTFIGNLGADPEVRFMPNGEPVANFTIATTRKWKDKDSGEKKNQTEWIRIVAYSQLAKIAEEYLKKGNQVYVEGRWKTRKWPGDDGKDNYTTEIIAEKMLKLGAKAEGGGSGRPPAPPNEAYETEYDDDIPF